MYNRLISFLAYVPYRLRMKQNKYPVMFLTQGVTMKYEDYFDPRTHSIPMGVHFALSIGILVSTCRPAEMIACR